MCVKYPFFVVLLFLLAFSRCSHQEAMDTKQHLFVYGFLNSTTPTTEQYELAIKKFQKLTGLDITGHVNEATLKKMSSPRCGKPSNAPLFLAARNKWRSSQITYKIRNWSEPFTKTLIKNIFEDSIKEWTRNVNLKISESTSNKADVDIFFTDQDGQYNVLGYAYFPENGDIFFDTGEDWTLDKTLSSVKTYFGWVATHELGHSLGLSHTENVDSIMFPYYSAEVTKPAKSDVSLLKALYGQAKSDVTVLCSKSSVDAILNNNNGRILIKGKQFWNLADGSLVDGPFDLDELYPELPDQVDAAFSVRGSSYFFKNDSFYKFKNKKKNHSEKLISIGFDSLPSNINAAFFDSNHIIYFFKGSKYYMFDIKKSIGKRVILNGKDISSDWNGIPNNLEAATLLTNSQVLFVKNAKCYVVDLNTKQLLSGQDCSSAFYGCKN